MNWSTADKIKNKNKFAIKIVRPVLFYGIKVMSLLRSVIITVPKGISKSRLARNSDCLGEESNLNFTTSILATKATMECRKTQRMQMEVPHELQGELIKPEVWLRGKKRRLDHLTWEEKLQRK